MLEVLRGMGADEADGGGGGGAAAAAVVVVEEDKGTE